MDGYPVHSYGTDPIAQAMDSVLDWRGKQKLLERQALNEAANQNRETAGKLTASGDFSGTPQDLVDLGYNSANAIGLANQNKRQSMANYVNSLTQTADLSKKTQDYQNAEITKLQTSMEYWEKKKNEVKDQGGDVIGINDNLQIIGKQLSKLTGLEFDPVGITDLSEMKKYKEDVAIKRVSELQMSLNDLMAKGDLEGAAKAAGALGSQIMTSSKQLNLPKDTFAAANSALEKFQAELPKILQDKVKGKEPTVVPIGTLQYKPNKDGTETAQRFQGMQGKEQVWKDEGIKSAPRVPESGSEEFKKKTGFIAATLKIPAAEAIKIQLSAKDMSKAQFITKSVSDMVSMGMLKPADVAAKAQELGGVYDTIHGLQPATSAKPGAGNGKKSYNYLWEKPKN